MTCGPYEIGQTINLGDEIGSGKIVSFELTRSSEGIDRLTGLYVELPSKEIKLLKLGGYKKGSFLGYDTLMDLLKASGYVESKGPQLVDLGPSPQIAPMKGPLAEKFLSDYRKAR